MANSLERIRGKYKGECFMYKLEGEDKNLYPYLFHSPNNLLTSQFLISKFVGNSKLTFAME